MINWLIGIKTWLYGALGILIIGFIGMFKYRGFKIKQQERDSESQQHEIAAMKEYSEQKDKVQSFEVQNKVKAEKAKHADETPDISDGSHSL